MLSNLQKNILLKYPLLWNTKFIPMAALGILLHILCFFTGYFDGTIDFTKKYDSLLEAPFFIIITLIIIVVFIVWLIQYFKNNAFKSFYPKSKNALFYEWLQIFIIVVVFSTFYVSVLVGQTLKKRSYFSEDEVKRRVEILSKADMFINGSFESPEIDSTKSVFTDTTINGQIQYRKIVYKEYVKYFGKQYEPTALINRKVFNFKYDDRAKDSLNTLAIRKWLSNNNQTEVKKLMSEYLAIHNDAKLYTNITVEKWFKEVYDYPNFKKYKIINYANPNTKDYDSTYVDYNDYESASPDEYYEFKNDGVYSDYFVGKNILNHNYLILLNSYASIWEALEFTIGILYFAFGFSLLLFSFKVTSGKSWLIAIVVTVLLNIVFGLISTIGREELTYLYLSVLTIIGLLLTLINLIVSKTNIRFSKVVVNLALWFFSAILPIIYFIYMEHYKNKLMSQYASIENYDYYLDPFYKFLNDNIFNMFIINLIVCIIALFFFSRGIRTWKGIPEE